MCVYRRFLHLFLQLASYAAAQQLQLLVGFVLDS